MPRDVVAVVSTHAAEASKQSAVIRRWAEEAGAAILRTYRPTTEDLGVLLDAVHQLHVERDDQVVVVVSSLAVLGDVVHQEAFRVALARAGGELAVANRLEALDGAEEVREMLHQYDVVSTALGARRKVAEMQRGADAVRAAGGRMGGRVEYGLRLVAGELVQDAEEEAACVRMEALYDQGVSYAGIGRQMKAEGYRRRDGGEEWHPDFCRRVILRRKGRRQEAG